MKKTVIILLIFSIALILFSSCNVQDMSDTTESQTEAAELDVGDVAGVYARKNDNELGDYFTITLNADGTYSYYATLFSSYIGMGEYTVDGNVITLTDNNIPTLEGSITLTFKFEYREGALIFLASQSDEFMYINPPEGAEFTRAEISVE